MMGLVVGMRRDAGIFGRTYRIAVADAPPLVLATAVDAGADAVLAASVFHFGTLSVAQVKEECARRGFPMRWPLEE